MKKLGILFSVLMLTIFVGFNFIWAQTTQETQAIKGVYSDGTNTYVKKGYKLDITAKDEESGVKVVMVSVNGTVLGKYRTPIILLQEGKNIISWLVEDFVGNKKLYTTELIVDGTGPIVSYVINGPKAIRGADIYISTNTQIAFEAVDNLSGVGKILTKVGDGEWAEYNNPLQLAQEGPVKVTYKGVDKVENESEEKALWVYVDATPPSVNIQVKAVKTPDDQLFVNQESQFTIIAEDGESGVKDVLYAIDDGEYKPYAGPFKLSAGKHVIKVKATDCVGNEKTIDLEVNVDITPPTSEAKVIE